jgi:tetratricopeptide (TPR) repeat protein
MVNSMVSDHLQYVAMVGIVALLVGSARAVVSRVTGRPKLQYLAGAMLISALMVLTFRQCRYYETPLSCYNYILAKNDKAWTVFFERGNVYSKSGQLTKAIKDYDRVIEIKPDYCLAYNNRGTAYLALGQLHHALHDYTETIRLRPTYAPAYSNRSNVYCSLGRIDEALRDDTRAIELDAENPVCYRNRAAVYFQKGAYDKAWADVLACRKRGGMLHPEFLEDLKRASGRDE